MGFFFSPPRISLSRKLNSKVHFSSLSSLTDESIHFVQCMFRPRGCHGDRGRKDFSASSSEEEESVAPSLSLLSLPSFKDVGNDSGGEKEVWVSVFTYLNRAELLACMTVCKAWYKWYVAHTQQYLYVVMLRLY